MKDYEVFYTDIENKEKLAYRTTGNGDKTLVLVHGNMSSSVHWQTTMEALENDYKIYAVDMRGFGDSTYNNRFDSLHELAVDIKQFIKNMNINQCSVVGWSTGGGVVLELAAMMPEVIEKVILVESVALTGYPMFKKDSKGLSTAERLSTKEEIENDAVQVIPALLAYKNKDKNIMRAIWNAAIYNLKQPPQEDYEKYLEAILKQRNLVDIDYSLVNFNMTHESNGVASGSGRIDDVKAPVVIIQGEKDLIVPPAWARDIKDAFSDRAKLIIFEETGHSPITDDPKLFFETLKENL